MICIALIRSLRTSFNHTKEISKCSAGRQFISQSQREFKSLAQSQTFIAGSNSGLTAYQEILNANSFSLVIGLFRSRSTVPYTNRRWSHKFNSSPPARSSFHALTLSPSRLFVCRARREEISINIHSAACRRGKQLVYVRAIARGLY